MHVGRWIEVGAFDGGAHCGVVRRGGMQHHGDGIDAADCKPQPAVQGRGVGIEPAQMKDILAKEKPTLQPLMQQMAQSHHDLRQLEESGNFDEAKVRALASQQAQTMTELIVQKARIHSELSQVLTPDQKAKMSQFMDRREQRFMKHMQNQTPPSQ